MAVVWRNRILAKTKLFSECPDRYKEKVEELLKNEVLENKLTEEECNNLLAQ